MPLEGVVHEGKTGKWREVWRMLLPYQEVTVHVDHSGKTWIAPVRPDLTGKRVIRVTRKGWTVSSKIDERGHCWFLPDHLKKVVSYPGDDSAPENRSPLEFVIDDVALASGVGQNKADLSWLSALAGQADVLHEHMNSKKE